MAANAWRILTEVRRKLDTEDWRVVALAADALVEACTFAPGLDLPAGLDAETWIKLDDAARATASLPSDVSLLQHLRSVLDVAITEVAWMESLGSAEDIRDGRAAVRAIQKLVESYKLEAT